MTSAELDAHLLRAYGGQQARLDGFKAWLAAAPPEVHALAHDFPLGHSLPYEGRQHYILGWSYAPAVVILSSFSLKNYELARATQFDVLASRLRGLALTSPFED